MRFLEVIHLFQSVGTCKKQTSVSHSFNRITNHFFGCRIDVGWYPRTWFYGIWSSQFLETRIGVIKNGETRLWTNGKFVQHLTQFKNEINLKQWSMIWLMLILFLQNVNYSHQEALLYVFEDSEAETHRVPLDWLFDRINLDPKNINQIHWHQKPTRRHTDQGKFHTWWMESSFVFVKH